ncbi:MAG: acetylxylan esterase [Mariniblastus sp.]|nr:acetylxylan esterase [Mariniblastus sp.]
MAFRTLAAPILTLTLVSVTFLGLSAAPPTNYDESKVPSYQLPDPLVLLNGDKVTDAKTWITKRRPEILELFKTQVYGTMPAPPKAMSFQVTSSDKKALGGKATRREVSIHFTADKKGPRLDLLLYLPNDADGPVPVFIGHNFRGNHTINADPKISFNKGWMRNGNGVVNNQATEATRGTSSSRWDVDAILAAGYGLVTCYYGDIDPDYDDDFQNGVHPLFLKAGQKKPGPSEWGSISAWAWGLSRGLDYLETDKDVDHKRVAVIGHSRLGKTSLWAGASDPRFALVISNNSGCGGAALSRRQFGETVKVINDRFPHWFCDNYTKYNEDLPSMPVDQHMLVALMAPRPVYIASAQEDRWADPRGEFLAGLGAHPVYRLLGKPGLPTTKWPGINQPVAGTIGYHVRSGQHDVTSYDWKQYILFADHHFGHDQ